jgi:mycothiol synthase
MAQLKMYWLPGTPIERYELPEGYSISNYKTESDKLEWCECCKHGLVSDTADASSFDRCITARAGLDPYKDTFFIDYGGMHIGTTTAYIHPDDNTGDMHMVGIRREFRGRGLSKFLTQVTCEHLDGRCSYIHLTTDDWRKPAIKGYLRGGFLPVLYSEWMERRWQSIVTEFGIDSLQMLNDDTTPYKVLSRRRVIRFGAWGVRNAELIRSYCRTHDDAELVAVYSDRGAAGAMTDPDAFLATDMDAVVLSGRPHFACEAMRTGLGVITTSAPCRTAGDAEALRRAVRNYAHVYAFVDPAAPGDGIQNFIRRTKGDRTAPVTGLEEALERTK